MIREKMTRVRKPKSEKVKIHDAYMDSYHLDDDVKALMIRIHEQEYGLGAIGLIETPDDEVYGVFTREKDDGIRMLEIVNPEEFIKSKTSDNLTVHGESIKELARKAIKEFNVDITKFGYKDDDYDE